MSDESEHLTDAVAGLPGGQDVAGAMRELAAESSAPAYPDDPEAPYFEHLYAAAQTLRPGITRDEALATIRDADPDDTLRIREPLPADRNPDRLTDDEIRELEDRAADWDADHPNE